MIPNPGHIDPLNYTTKISGSILDLSGKQLRKLLTHSKWKKVRKAEELKELPSEEIKGHK